MLSESIAKLVQYGITTGLTPECERNYTTNLLLDVFHEDDYEKPDNIEEPVNLEATLGELLDEAVKRGLIEDSIVYRDLFDTRLMNCLMPRPGQVQKEFWDKYAESPKKATDYFYKLSQDSNYIRRYRVEKDQKWKVDSPYGEIDITINLSKPEKDPKAIAAARNVKSGSYPKCLLCPENEGYAGRVNHPARQNHRVIPIKLGAEQYFLQYSPYVYYNEHCIIFNEAHRPMKIDQAVFRKLLEFVKLFPHYTAGSNADLPIVGGSILSHDHFQGGGYVFAMAKAPYESEFVIPGYEDLTAGIVRWPMSVIRLRGTDTERITLAADHILTAWRRYTDKEAFIFSETDGTPHNTITPIARMHGNLYELDLVLRNNVTTDECPWGVYHPSADLHHIKKENIGLIEVMGLAVLPARLKKEMALLEQYILEKQDVRSNPQIEKHADWVDSWLGSYEITEDNIHAILQKEIGKVFVQVLECAGVYKNTKKGRIDFGRFIETL